MTAENPLLRPSDLPYRLPRFGEITPAHYEEAYLQGMAAQRAEIAAITAEAAEATFDNTIVALERSGELLRRTHDAFDLVVGADGTPELEALEEQIAPLRAAHDDAIHLDRALFARIHTLYENRAALGLDPVEMRLLERYHTDFVRAGAGLDEAQATRLEALNAELATLTTEFSNKVRAAAVAATIDVSDLADLDGLSADGIDAARETAQGRGTPYSLSFSNTTSQPPLAELTDRALRERIHRASIERGSDGGPHDTRDLVLRIVKLRAQRAELLGFAHHAAYQIADNTARTVDTVTEMLAKLAPAAVANAHAEAADLQAIIGDEFRLAAWDWSFYAERERLRRYGIDEAEIRPYLELERVLHDGVFYAAGKLYGITFTERADLAGYHEDVRFFTVKEADGRELGLFLLDLYARPSKRGGAWMQSLETPNDMDGVLPVVTNTLNVLKPPPGHPTLLTLDDLKTLFHEFGHALHGLFGHAKFRKFAGAETPQDFVEFPSQVNEMWALDAEVLPHYAFHVDTSEPMPREIAAKLIESSSFNEGYATTEYLAASLLDLAWHTLRSDEVPDDVLTFEAAALEAAGVAVAEVPPRYRSTYFGHSFSGPDYSAGYYSYIWAEVLDADTVEWFKENGGLTRANGDRYRYDLLGKCGSADPIEVYRAFRGHDPDVTPLLVRRKLRI